LSFVLSTTTDSSLLDSLMRLLSGGDGTSLFPANTYLLLDTFSSLIGSFVPLSDGLPIDVIDPF
jgi:hypothetical protein